MTEAQREALKWLQERGGDAVRQGKKNGRQQVLCRGEIAPFEWKTFKRLIEGGLLEQLPNWRLRLKEVKP